MTRHPAEPPGSKGTVMTKGTAVLLAGIWAAATAALPATPDDLILDETAYWRVHLVCRPAYVSPGPLKAEGERLLGKYRFARAKRDTLKRLGGNPKVDWREHVLLGRGRGDGRAVGYFSGILSRLMDLFQDGAFMIALKEFHFQARFSAKG